MPRRILFSAVVALATTLHPLGALQAAAPHVDEREATLLYETHCRACHTEQVHWREGRRAIDWASLVKQVDRWQKNLGLGWSDADVRVVAHYLNLRYYRFAPAPARVIARN